MEDPKEFCRSGEKGKGSMAREYCSRDKVYSLVPRLPGWSFLRLICDGNVSPSRGLPEARLFLQMKIGKIFKKSMQLLKRTLFLWCESMGILACVLINGSPHYIVGVSDAAKMESLWDEGVNMRNAFFVRS